MHRISLVLAELNASVDQMENDVIDVLMSGENLFTASVRLYFDNAVFASKVVRF